MSNIKALLALYVKIGGSLTDTVSGVNGGSAVSEYSKLTDALKAIYVKCGGTLSTVYSDISALPVLGYSQNAEVVYAIAKVARLYVAPVLETAQVTPTTSAQNITPEEGVTGFNKIEVGAVTAAIDQNIVAENIKKDVEILGVVGTYEA